VKFWQSDVVVSFFMQGLRKFSEFGYYI
jgi:hypothetical protein